MSLNQTIRLFIRFSRHIFAVEMRKAEIKMNKPVYLGQAILDLSKTLMYQFHCEYMSCAI